MSYYETADPAFIKKQKAKARELRASSWWKQQVGKGVCYHCEQKFRPDELTMDHLIPISRGGQSSKQNCVPCCKDCNNKKGMKTRAEMAMESLRSSSESAQISSENDSNDDSTE